MALLKTFFSCLAVVLVLLSACEAREFVVGKEKSWKIPSDSQSSYNDWASSQRFVKGDHLVFKYDGKADSVVEVNYDGYKNCNAQKPYALKSFNDGDTKIKLNGPGPYYFISGNTDNCEKGEKLEVMLVKERHHHISPAPAPTPSTTTTTTTPNQAPAPAPASGGSSLKNGVLGSVAVVFGLGLGFLL
ncbi:early nodulin-like protein 15 [Apium graveolens]|uniref:early nodulin-like protein 15 n=1 Tax=Apium graveolens TaxID=4045 RepID=UPI003D79B480